MRLRLTLCLLFISGLLLRIWCLSPDTLYFADEAHYIEEARFLARLPGGGILMYGKPLYSALLGFGMWLGKNQIVGAQAVQVVLAALWIPLIFLMARKLNLSKSGAVLAALIASCDPWFYLLSRHLFPDVLSGLLWMSALIFLLEEESVSKHIMLSGLLFGLSVASNYRMILFGAGTLFFLIWNHKGTLKGRIQVGSLWLGFLFLPLLVIHFMYEWFRPSEALRYLSQVLILTEFHAGFGTAWKSWMTYPLLMRHYEGGFFIFLVLLGIFLLFKRGFQSTTGRLVLCVYGFPVLLFAFAYFTPSRLWAVLLFWHPLLAVIALEEIGVVLGRHLYLRASVWKVGFLTCLLFSFVPRLLAIQKIHVPYQEALRWLDQREVSSPKKIISTSPILVHQLVPEWTVMSLAEGGEALSHLKKENYRFVWVDGYQYTRTTKNSLSPEREGLPLKLSQVCSSVADFYCSSSEEMWSDFAWSHNVQLGRTLKFIREKDLSHTPCIEIYDLKTCPL